MLSDLGADVVKLEPPEGDVTRVWGDIRHGLSGFYTQQNAGKRNVCIDLKRPDAAALVTRLAAAADVVIENFRPGVLTRLGLGWPVLAAANPRLVLLSITGFGQTGPSSARRAYAPVIHAESGLIGRQAAFDDGGPTDPMLSIADTNAGLHGTIAILAALRLRDATGIGQHIDMAMFDAMLATDDYAHHAIDGFPIRRLGGEVWSAPGGPLLVAGEFRHIWRQVATVHGVVAPTPVDVDFATKVATRRAAFATWLLDFPDRTAVCVALEAADLAWADVRAPMEVFDAPSVAARRIVASIDDRGGGQRGVVQSPYRFSAAVSGVRGPAPHRGEHNGSVLLEWLGMNITDVEELVEAGVLHAEEVTEA